MRKLGLLATALVLTGCVGGTQNVAPVVDRSQAAGSPVVKPKAAAAGTVITAPVDTGVTVSAVEDQPIQQVAPASAGQSSGGTWVTAQAASRDHQVNPAVVALLDNARQQTRSGSYSAAASTLERAQRIAPREPEVYYEMARVRLKSGDWSQAEHLALKGVQLSAGSDAMLNKLWLLIADIREDAGDQPGAQRARIKARRY